MYFTTKAIHVDIVLCLSMYRNDRSRFYWYIYVYIHTGWVYLQFLGNLVAVNVGVVDYFLETKLT